MPTAVAEKTDALLSDGCVTVGTACKVYGFSKSRLYAWMASGRVPYTLVTGRRLIPRQSLVKLLASGLVGVGLHAEE